MWSDDENEEEEDDKGRIVSSEHVDLRVQELSPPYKRNLHVGLVKFSRLWKPKNRE